MRYIAINYVTIFSLPEVLWVLTSCFSWYSYITHSFPTLLVMFLLLVNIPVERIRLLDTMCLLLGKRRRARQKTPCAFCSGVVSAWCRLLWKSDVWPIDPLTRWPFKKRTPQRQFRGPPTYTHQVWRRSVKGPQRSRRTNKQTDRQTLLDL